MHCEDLIIYYVFISEIYIPLFQHIRRLLNLQLLYTSYLTKDLWEHAVSGIEHINSYAYSFVPEHVQLLAIFETHRNVPFLGTFSTN